MRLACLSVCVFGLLVGCNDDGVTIDATATTVCQEIAEVFCNNWYQCCTEGEIEDNLNVSEPRTEAQCREDLARSCTRSTATLNDSVIAGRVMFDPVRMNTCLNSVIAPEGVCASVVSELPWETACKDDAWVGLVAVGGSCFFNHDCQGAPDVFCAPNQKCTAKPISGQPCGAGCASDYYCSLGICQPRVGAGVMCTSSLSCQEDLFCDTSVVPSVCAGRLPGGSACTSNFGCESSQCIPGQCMGTTQTCYKDTDCIGRCADDNTFCTTAAQCQIGNCSDGFGTCSSNANCTAPATCVFMVQCLSGDCIGDPVCTNATLTVDYCDSSGAVPIL